MLGNQKIQNAIKEIEEISHCSPVLYQTDGTVIASAVPVEPAWEAIVREFAESAADEAKTGSYLLFRIAAESQPEYVLFTVQNGKEAETIGRMAACQLRNLFLSMAEPYDRNSFMQNVLLGNLLAADIVNKSKRLHIEDAERVVFVIDTGAKNNQDALETVRNLFNVKTRDFVTQTDEHSIVLIKDMTAVPKEQQEEELSGIASNLVDTLHMEAMIKVRVGYGNSVSRIVELASSFQEAKMALEVGRIFYAEYDTISYGRLGIGRLIYQLPMNLCRMFIREVFGNGIPEIFEDEEAMSTINQFYENNLNISETARQLYIHRNTLVYRLERIEKAIGLDIRRFDDAMTFRIASMVLAHIKAQEKEQ